MPDSHFFTEELSMEEVLNKEIYKNRIRELQSFMLTESIDICLLLDRENLIYFGGIEQVECMTIVVPSKGDPVGITLWLDVEYIKENCSIEDIRGYTIPKQTIVDKVAEAISEMNYENPVIGFERYFISFSYFKELRDKYDVKSFIDFSIPIYKCRAIKDESEILNIKKAADAVRKGMDAVIENIKPGIRELDLAAEAEYASMKSGSQGTPFRPQIISGKKILSTHPFSNNDVINNNSIVVVHIGAKVNGYIAKMCRTAAVGKVNNESIKIYNSIKDTQKILLDELKSGVSCDYLSKLALQNMEKLGYGSKYLHIMGYGVGLRQSEFYPVISTGNPTILEKNMVVDFLMPTIYDKKYGGPRITDTILIKENGCDILTDYQTELIYA